MTPRPFAQADGAHEDQIHVVTHFRLSIRLEGYTTEKARGFGTERERACVCKSTR
jgi:hypothetical protein